MAVIFTKLYTQLMQIPIHRLTLHVNNTTLLYGSH